AFEDDVSDLPAPTRDAAVELEGREQLVSLRVDCAARPLVCGQPDAGVTGDEDGIERDEAHHPLGRTMHCNHEEPVIAAGPQRPDRPHRIAAEAVGDEPLALRRLVESSAAAGAERDPHACASSRCDSRSSTRGASRRRMRRWATRPVQPVWCVAPRPAPLSPWKYSLKKMLSCQAGSFWRRS